jgi:hypothetical protein
MTINKLGYNIPSTFQIIKSIDNNSPKMLQVHKDEFNRTKQLFESKTYLSKPYTDYIQMLYIKYIANDIKIIQSNVNVIHQHIGIKMLNKIALT